jgi:malate synthase
VPIYNLMEDAATAEISRTQVWQWIHHGAQLGDGRTVTLQLVRDTTASVLNNIRSRVGAPTYDAGKFPLAAQLFEQMMVGPELTEFLTLEAYRYL